MLILTGQTEIKLNLVQFEGYLIFSTTGIQVIFRLFTFALKRFLFFYFWNYPFTKFSFTVPNFFRTCWEPLHIQIKYIVINFADPSQNFKRKIRPRVHDLSGMFNKYILKLSFCLNFFVFWYLPVKQFLIIILGIFFKIIFWQLFTV